MSKRLFDEDELDNQYSKLPQKLQQDLWEKSGRDWKAYLSNIEWDTYTPETEEEKKLRLEEIERERHPFKEWI